MAAATQIVVDLPADRPGDDESFEHFIKRHYGWDTAGHQARFLADPARYRAAIAGIGGGKTEVGAFDAIRHCIRWPGIKSLVVAPTYRMLSRSTLPTFLQVAQWWPDLRVEFKKSEYCAVFPDLLNSSGEPSLVWFGYAEDPESLRGPTVGFFWLDEGGLCKRDAWRILEGRIRQPNLPKKAHRGWVTGTPKGRNWLYEMFVAAQEKRSEQERADYGFHTWSTHDNPLYKTDPEYVRSLEASYGIGTDFYRQELLAQFVTWEGLVYNNFDQDRHVRPAPEGTRWQAHCAAVDWGWANPAVITVHGLATDGVAYQRDEFAQSRLPIGDLVAEGKRLQGDYGILVFFCDPSEPANIYEFQKAGLNAVPAFNAIQPGVSAVAGRIATSRYYLDPRCTETLKEFLAYSYPEGADGKVKRDVPVDAHNHCMDTVRYAVTGMDGLAAKPIQQQATIQLTEPVTI